MEVQNQKDKIEPIPVIDKEGLTKEEIEHYKQLGEDLIKNKKVAVCTMAGGQGSRLGHVGPKGTFLLPFSSGSKPIFQIVAEHLQRVYKKYGIWISWYIMTSEENDEETKKFFDLHNCFEYPKEDICFFKQGQLPLLDLHENPVFKKPNEVYMVPNGNGGIFCALEENGILKEFEQKNIQYLVTCNVDNILINPVDPIMLGVLQENKAELGIKTILKRSAMEPAGVCCLKNNKPTVIEYIDLTKEMAEQKNQDGCYTFGDIHFGCNYLSLSLLLRIKEEKLPYHFAKKKNQYYDANGQLVLDNEINSLKREMFIFDGFEKAQRAIAFRVKREEEFAPIKNKEGEDSPKTAMKLYEEYWQKEKSY